LLDPVVAKAIAACRVAYDQAADAAEARQVLLTAQAAGQVGIDHLTERTEAVTLRAAHLFIAAMVAADEAEGVARAVGLMRRGEPWTPRNLRDDEAALFGEAVRRTG